MKILIDMNLSPRWVEALGAAGHEVAHWSQTGSPSAPDSEIMRWAAANGFVIFTHDLDFGAILAAGGDTAPSVIQLREQNIAVGAASGMVIAALDRFEAELESGALVSIQDSGARARVLPLRKRPVGD